MKKIYTILCFVLLMLGCETNVDPNGFFRNRLVFYSVLSEGDSVQKAILYKLAAPNEDGTAPLADREIIKNASIRVWSDKDNVVVFKFKDDKYDDSVVPPNCYYADNFKPEPDVKYSVEINTEDGLVVTSWFQMPKDLSYFKETADFTIPRRIGTTDTFWDAFYWLFNEEYWERYYIAVRPWLQYTVKKDGVTENKKYLIPAYYEEKEGKKEPVKIQPEIAYNYELKTSLLEEVLTVVAGSEPEDAKIKFEGVLLEGLSFSDELKTYYVTNNRYGSNFSAIIDKYDYSNIYGGHGLFAGTGYIKTFIKIDQRFITLQKIPNVVINY